MSVLENEDLRAVPQSGRGWGTRDYAALWVGMAVCIPSYMLAAGYIKDGMSWWQALATVLLGNLIVLLPMLANGHAGAKYGIPFPVFARASFGLAGANLPALLRALIACGWFGINTWVGGAALAVVLEKTGIWPGVHETGFLADALGLGGGAAEGGPTGLASALHVHTGDFICFMLFWAINMAVVWAGIDSIRKLLSFKSVFLTVATLGLLYWAVSQGNGWGDIFSRPSQIQSGGAFVKLFALSVTGAVGFWSTLSLNIPDFTRYAKSQEAQVRGQALALPTSMTAIAFVAIAVTSITGTLPQFHGQPEWNPIAVVQNGFTSTWLIALGMFCVVLSTLATNIAANIVSPANDFAHLWPSRINFQIGGYISGVISIFMLPWKLLEDPHKYIDGWLVGYSALLGPIGGILIADYFLVRGKELDVNDLYRWGGRYDFKRGWNPVALVAFVVGLLPNLPGFFMNVVTPSLKTSLPEGVASFFDWVYSFAWIVGFLLAAAVYRAGMGQVPLVATAAPASPESKPA